MRENACSKSSKNGECIYSSPSVTEIAEYCKQEKDSLWERDKTSLLSTPGLM